MAKIVEVIKIIEIRMPFHGIRGRGRNLESHTLKAVLVLLLNTL
jgi:hypothetical protein